MGVPKATCEPGQTQHGLLCYNNVCDGETVDRSDHITCDGGRLKKPFPIKLNADGCPETHPSFEAGLCYKLLGDDYDCTATICWQKCVAPFSVEQGAVCCQDGPTCQKFHQDVLINAGKTAKDLLEMKWGGSIEKMMELAANLSLLSCDQANSGRRASDEFFQTEPVLV